jgi:hypothetical protein
MGHIGARIKVNALLMINIESERSRLGFPFSINANKTVDGQQACDQISDFMKFCAL